VVEATERLSFDVRLRARGLLSMPDPIPLNQIEVHYYFSQEETSGWQAQIDSFVQRAPDLDLGATSTISVVELVLRQNSTSGGCQSHFIRIRNESAHELAIQTAGGEPYLEFRVTLVPTNPAAPNQTHTNDHSYDGTNTDFDPNTGLAVYVCGQLVSGCSPGDAGTCS
jgi:hypothetical protein